MQRLLQACDHAARRHTGQTRHGTARDPYANHLIEVAARVARRPEAPGDLVLGALLHEVIDDTDGTAANIAALSGAEVAALVAEVTDDKTLPKAECKAWQVLDVAGKSVNATA